MIPGQWFASIAMTCTVVSSPVVGEWRESEYQLPISRMLRSESLKPGNLIGKSLAVMREQKSGPHFQVGVKPEV